MSKATILIVDDEPDVLGFNAGAPRAERLRGRNRGGGCRALVLLAEGAPALLITDLRMPQMDGLELLGKVREQNPKLPCIVLTAAGDVSTAVRAMRAGAAAYLTKPIDVGALLLSVERVLEHQDLQTEAENLRGQLRARDQDGLSGLLGTSLPMQRIYRMAHQVAPARATVLITGVRHRQGPSRPRHSRAESASAGAVRLGALRGIGRGRAGERALRPRKWRLHRRRQAAARALRASQRRYAVSR